MSWWYSKSTEDDKYVLIEDKLESFQNSISKVQTDSKKREEELLELIEELRNEIYDLSKDVQNFESLKNDILVIKSDIESLKRKTDEVYLNPYDLLTHAETMNLDDFLSEPMDIIAEENTIQIGGSLNRKSNSVCDRDWDNSERIKSKNLNNKKRNNNNNNKKQWKA